MLGTASDELKLNDITLEIMAVDLNKRESLFCT